MHVAVQKFVRFHIFIVDTKKTPRGGLFCFWSMQFLIKKLLYFYTTQNYHPNSNKKCVTVNVCAPKIG